MVLATDLPDDQEQGHADRQCQQAGARDHGAGLVAPVGKQAGHCRGRNDRDRIAAQRRAGSEAVLAVDRALDLHGPDSAIGPHAVHQRRLDEFLPDHGLDMRVARDQRSVAMEHGNRSALAERDGSEEFFEIAGVDAPAHHAKEDTVGPGQAVGDHGGPAAGKIAAYRLDQYGFRRRARLQHPEILAVGDIDVGKRPDAR